jgi:uncharacterized membrane protein
MTRYELLVFLHVASAIVWLGAGATLGLMAIRALRSSDPLDGPRLAQASEWLTPRLFIPASLATLVFGILLVLDGPWSFGDLWLALGLAGYTVSFVTGIAFIDPEAKRLHRAAAEHGATSSQAMRHTRRVVLVSRLELVVLFAVVSVMVAKPSGDDVGMLVGLAVAIAAVWALILLASRSRPVAARSAPAAE